MSRTYDFATRPGQVLLALGTLLLLLLFRRVTRAQRRRLPGPHPHWLIGNLRDVPKGGNEWLAFNELSKRFGSDVVQLDVLGSHIVVINSYEAARDLLDKKGAIYSDRPRLVMIKELMGWSWNLVLMSYKEGFAAHRKIVQQEFQANVVSQNYHSIMSAEVVSLIRRVVETPENVIDHLKLMTGAIIMMVTYGHKVTSFDDEYVSLAEEVRAHAEERPGTNLVDIFPPFKYIPSWFPGAGFKHHAAQRRQLAFRMRSEPYEMAKRNLEKGKVLPCMTTRLLQQDQISADSIDREELIRNCTGVVYSAGADTTATALTNFVLAMTLYPEIQSRAQEELDAVLGRGRLPTFDDRTRLPFVSNVVKETLRWKPITNLGVPHSTAESDEYRGAYIAKRTTVIANLYAILHDQSVYDDPEAFKPDRYLPTKENPGGEPDPSRAAFGFGRRICPGRFFAADSVWLTIATFLHCISTSDPTGKSKVHDVTWKSGLVSVPSAFPFKLEPRFARVSELIAAAEDS